MMLHCVLCVSTLLFSREYAGAALHVDLALWTPRCRVVATDVSFLNPFRTRLAAAEMSAWEKSVRSVAVKTHDALFEALLVRSEKPISRV